jgi:outer membrane lipoprotein-sorting protein
VLSLHPRQAQAQVKEITFVVDADSFLVRESVLVDGQGNVNDMLFSDIKIGSGLPDSTFRWSPPAGTRVIDTAKLGK